MERLGGPVEERIVRNMNKRNVKNGRKKMNSGVIQ